MNKNTAMAQENTLKVISWNVNGLRSVTNKGALSAMLENENPDVLCLQEIRCDDACADRILRELPGGYDYVYHNTSKTKKGYSGTAIVSRVVPLEVRYDLPTENENKEGRVITAVFGKMVLVNVYTPNSGPRTLARLEYRTNTWDVAFGEYLSGLTVEFPRKTVVVCGDLNVAHREIDVHNPRANVKNAGFTVEERTSFENNVLNHIFIDAFRHLYPNKVKYSWWSAMGQARSKNKGWRIDYFLIQNKTSAIKMIRDCDILDNVTGSDHAPVYLMMGF